MLVTMILGIGVLVQGVSALAESSKAPTALIQADKDRITAMIRVDEDGMKRVLSEELHYAHSSGLVEDKKAFIDALTSRKLLYRAYEYEKQSYTFPVAGMALMQGIAKVQITNASGDLNLRLGYLAIWRLEGVQWKFLAWQSCRLPELDAGKTR